MPPKPAHLFPPSNAPRTWLITAAASPIGLRLARALLDHGDNLVLGLPAADLQKLKHARLNGNATPPSLGPARRPFAEFINGEAVEKGWRDRTRVVALDGRAGQCQAAVATAIESFGSLDILLCCTSEAVVGTVEELAASEHTMTLVREQFETNFFGPINMIKAALPAMRARRSGHIITLTGITSHLGTPGLSAYCSSGWAIEGFCDSLAYEIAPFNVKLTIVQPSYEISVLTNQISAAPAMPQYMPPLHPAPLSRAALGRLLDRIHGIRPSASENGDGSEPRSSRSLSVALINGDGVSSSDVDENASGSARAKGQSTDIGDYPATLGSTKQITTLMPSLSTNMLDTFVAETVHALIAIGGHENPPARHIVGYEGIASVKEKLKTVSEELEDFVNCSNAVDIEPAAKH